MNKINQKFVVVAEESGQRLDRFLISKFSGISRAKIQKIIKENLVKVNEKMSQPSYIVKTNDVVEAKLQQKSPFRLKPNKNLKVPIVFENKDYLIVNKPAGMVVHPGEGHLKNDTLTNWLVAKYPEIKKVESEPLRPGIVHRLDRETSGVMLVAKTNEFYKHIREQFNKRKVKKTYLAWVKGEIKKDEFAVSKPLKRGRGFKWIAAKEGREAVTYFKVLERKKGKTLLEVNPVTGRMHQIRVHLASIGHPVVGDVVYGKDRKGPLILHAYRIQFEDLGGEMKSYQSGPPAYFEK